MGRAIVTAKPHVDQAFPDLQGSASARRQKPDTYRDRLFKYIPSEVVTLYLGATAIVAASQNSPHFLYWAIFAAGLIGTPFYLRYQQEVKSRIQLGVSTLAYVVWVFALGGPFADSTWYKPVYGAVLLPIFTFFVAVIKPMDEAARQSTSAAER